MQDNKFLVPLAIVVAGAMVAGAIYLGGNGQQATGNRQPVAEATEITLPAVSTTDHILGSAGAPIVAVEYSDLECPFCKNFHYTMKDLLQEYEPNLAWVYRHFPIPQLHQRAVSEAIATECAAEQGGNTIFWKYLDEVFATTNSNDSLAPAELPRIADDLGLDVSAFNECLESGKYDTQIQESMSEAAQAGALGTPYTVLVLKSSLTKGQEQALQSVISSNGLGSQAIRISKDKKKVALGGALPLELMRQTIDAILEN